MKKNNKITIEQLQKELEFLNTKEFVSGNLQCTKNGK